MRIARPLILLLSGRADITPPLFQVRASFDYNKKLGRREWLRARLVQDDDGVQGAEKYHTDGAGILSSMSFADGLIELSEEQGPFRKGTMVNFLPFSELIR